MPLRRKITDWFIKHPVLSIATGVFLGGLSLYAMSAIDLYQEYVLARTVAQTEQLAAQADKANKEKAARSIIGLTPNKLYSLCGNPVSQRTSLRYFDYYGRDGRRIFLEFIGNSKSKDPWNDWILLTMRDDRGHEYRESIDQIEQLPCLKGTQ